MEFILNTIFWTLALYGLFEIIKNIIKFPQKKFLENFFGYLKIETGKNLEISLFMKLCIW